MKKIMIMLAGFVLAGLPALPLWAAETTPAVQQMPASSETPITAEIAPVPPVTTADPVLEPAEKPAQAVKIGYVDMAKVAAESAAGKAAAADVKARAGKFRTQIEAKQKQLEKQKKEIEATIQTLSPQQRTAKAKEFQKKIEDFQKFVEKAQKDLQARESELLGKLFAKIEKAAAEYGKSSGVAAVVVKKEVLYMAENVEVADFTDEIIKMVDSEQGKK